MLINGFAIGLYMEILQGSINQQWNSFKKLLEELIQQHIPTKSIDDTKRRKAPWLSHKAVKLVRRKHRVYARYKGDSHPAYQSTAKEADKKVRRAKYNYEKLADNIKKDTKSYTCESNSKK